jgi:hypothetical protein
MFFETNSSYMTGLSANRKKSILKKTNLGYLPATIVFPERFSCNSVVLGKNPKNRNLSGLAGDNRRLSYRPINPMITVGPPGR